MDPVFVVLWAILSVYVGFFVGWFVPQHRDTRWRWAYARWQQMKIELTVSQREPPWGEYTCDVMLGLAVLVSFVGIGLGCGVFLGNSAPWGAATVIAFALAVGLAWGAFHWLSLRGWRMLAPVIRGVPAVTWSPRG